MVSMTSKQAGEYQGRHFTQWVDDVKALKRDGRLADAANLLEGLMTATIAEANAEGFAPAPWYFEQAAIVYGKIGDQARARAALARYIGVAGEAASPGIADRLRKFDAKETLTVQPTTACPACGTVLDPPPTRTRKCPHCSEKITVRTIDGTRYLLSPQQVRERENADRRHIILRFANEIGVDEARFNERAASTTSDGDTFWSLANERALELIPEVAYDWLKLRDHYKVMADFLEFEGRDPSQIDHQSIQAALRYELLSGRSPDQIMRVVGCECEPCGKGEETYRLGDLDVNGRLPIPHSGCDRDRCKCWFWVDPNQAIPITHTITVNAADLDVGEDQGVLGRMKRRWFS